MAPNSNSPNDGVDRYQQAVNDIFDYVRHVCLLEGLSMQEALGVLTVVRGSIQINLARQQILNQLEDELENEGEDYDDE